jgi:hypothetical protein
MIGFRVQELGSWIWDSGLELRRSGLGVRDMRVEGLGFVV